MPPRQQGREVQEDGVAEIASALQKGVERKGVLRRAISLRLRGIPTPRTVMLIRLRHMLTGHDLRLGNQSFAKAYDISPLRNLGPKQEMVTGEARARECDASVRARDC